MDKCHGITKQAQRCRRPATVRVDLRSGAVFTYCAQHAGGSGVMRMLLPFPWEIERVGDAR